MNEEKKVFSYNNYTIANDKMCYILTETALTQGKIVAGKKTSEGIEFIKKQTYYPNLELAILKMAENNRIDKLGKTKLKDLANEINIINNDFIIKLKGLL